MSMIKRFITGVFFLGLFLGSVIASAAQSNIMVTEPRVRAMPPGTSNTAAYMNIKNTGKTNISLQKVTSSISNNIQLHDTIKKDGKMSMVEQESIIIPAGKRVKLQPRSLHVMIMKVSKTLVTGEKVSLDLHFSNGEVITVKAPVKKQVLEKGNLSG
ncbi:copper chaperone PCu(A)C [Sansalvadorimonas sp. 2012CJ34-2]|uniref:Copper chaperone PCu(A)C n=1 Tax=Parendozoicomonas callyspongiae TaxID=2942213 RepID=A0ABT0PEU6_9GAMM|nr:copper chaperone PCu(A)C [Sansalvadorimonas sp. 2012CJ34-2]MCL6269914.1 copper chaperone PCu(A)C [Sansalvadorimonas sp. 2012CJ34-2]